MHCASCSAIITKKISNVVGVTSVNVNYATEQAKLEYDPHTVTIADMNNVLEPLGYLFLEESESHSSGTVSQDSTDTSHHEAMLHSATAKMEFVLPLSLFVFFIMMWEICAKYFISVPSLPIPMELLNSVLLPVATIVMFWAGKQFVEGVVRFVQYRVANMDTLIGIGTLTAYSYSACVILFPQVMSFLKLPLYTYFDVVIVVIGFVTFGKYLEMQSKQKTGEAIQRLLTLEAKTAHVLRDGVDTEIAARDVVHGDIVIVKPGQRIPVDGIVRDGSSFVDESMITGEPIPVEKAAGATVTSGTLNSDGAFTFTATKVGSETMLAQIIRMVEDAQGSRAPVQALADTISSVFVPSVLGIAVVSLVAWILFGVSSFGFSQAVSYGIVSFVGVLIIACPCALGLATPTAIIVGVGKGAQEGILIKDAASLEMLHKVTVVVVDKTGTITKGKPEFDSLKNMSGMSDHELMSIIASLEAQSEHPIAHALTMYAHDHNLQAQHVHTFEAIKGKGVRGTINGTMYYVGNRALINDLSVAFDFNEIEQATMEGKTPLILATAHAVLGVVMVADQIKEKSAKAVADLQARGIRVIMLTGDDSNTAAYIAKKVGIDEVYGNMLPYDKLMKIHELQSSGAIVAMTGDGVNDAPALAAADVGIAMGTGTDVAIEAAGITLLHGDIAKLVQAIKLSTMTMRGIKQNLFFAFIYNVVGIPLAAGAFYPIFGWVLNPVFAGLAMALSSVSVVSNSLRIKAMKL